MRQARWRLEDVRGLRLRAELTFQESSGTGGRSENAWRSFEGQDRSGIASVNKTFSVRYADTGQKGGSGADVTFGIDRLEGLDKGRVRAGAPRVRCAGPVADGVTELACFPDPGRYQVRVSWCTLDNAKVVEPKLGAAGQIKRERANDSRQSEAERFGARVSDRRKIAEFHNG